MEDNPNNQDDIDFSIITPGNDKPKQLDFSVNELLENANNPSNSPKRTCQNNEQQQAIKQQGSFMKDLEKMEKQISYQTNPYDIYEPSQQQGQFTGTIEAKQEDTCTKTTNNLTKLCDKNLQNQFKHLILDFTDDRCSKLKAKESYEDYFDGEILTTKKISQKHVQKQISNKVKTKLDLEKGLHSKLKNKNSTSRASLLSNQRSKSRQSQISKVSSKKKTTVYYLKPSPPKQFTKQSNSKQKSKSKQKSVSKGQNRTKKKIAAQDKFISNIKSEAFSQYYGFEATENRTQKGHKKFTSKSKKIIYSNKNVNLYH